MLKLLQSKLPFELNCDFIHEQIVNCLNLYILGDELWMYTKDGKKLLTTSSLLGDEREYFKRFNPPRVELKNKIKDRYPFFGHSQVFNFDWDVLAKYCAEANLQHKIFLLVDEQMPGNTLLQFDMAPHSDWQLSCLNISTNSHCLYMVNDLKANARLELDCLSVTNMQSLDKLLESSSNTELDRKLVRAEQGFVIYADIAKDAKFTSTSCNFKSACLNDAVIHLNEDGAEAEVYAAMFANNKVSQSTHLEIRHHAPHTNSFMLCNGVVQARCSGEFVGRGYIDKGAHGSNCRQESRFLTLDKTAKAKTYPLLIIDEYDVVAGHATSVGQLNPDALYYMQSRGLTADLAKKLMTRGFLIPVVDHFNNQLLQQLGVKLLELQTDYVVSAAEDVEMSDFEADYAAESTKQMFDFDADKILTSKDVK